MDPLESYLATKQAPADPLAAYVESKAAARSPVNLHPRSEMPSDPTPGAPTRDEQVGVDSVPPAGPDRRQREHDKYVAENLMPEPKQEISAGPLNSMADRFSFGAYGALLRAIGDPGGAAAGMDKYRGEHPILSEITDAPGYAVEGPASAVAKGVDMLFPKVANRAAQVARTALSGAATSGLFAGTDAMAHGKGPADIAKATGHGAETGLLVGGGLGTLGPLADAVMSSRGGQARQFVEKYGGEVGPTTPGRGAPYNDMVTQGTTDADIGRQSVASAQKGLGMLNAQDAARKRPIGEMMSRLDRSPAGEEPRNVDNLYSTLDEEVNRVGAPPRTESTLGWALDEMDKANRDRYTGQPEIREPIVTRQRSTDDPSAALEKIVGKPLDKATPGELRAAFNTLRQNEKIADAALRAGKPVPDRLVQQAVPADPRSLKESELNRIRRGVSEKAHVGTSVSGQDAGGREAAGMMRDMVNEGPYAGVNRDYARAAFTNQKDRRLLGIAERRQGPVESRTAEERVANVIGRRGQRTVTAGKDIDRLAQFEKRNPEIGAELAKPALLRAKGDLSFGVLPVKHGGLIDRVSSVGGAGAALNAVATLAGHGHGSVGKTLGALAGALTLRNLPAIQGRLLYGPAAGLKNPDVLKLLPLLNAARAQENNQ